MEHYRLQEWINFIATELHKGFGPLFNPHASGEWKQAAKSQLIQRIGHVERRLAGKTWLVGDQFTIADAYLFTVLGWAAYVGLDLSPWPTIGAHLGRVSARSAVQAALKAEGLLS